MANNDNYSPQSPEPSELSPTLTPPMNVSTFDSLETSHTTTDDNTLYSDDERRRIYFVPSTPTPPPPPRKLKMKLSLSKRSGIVAEHLRSLRSDDHLSKGYPRPIKKELETLKTFQTHLRTINFVILSI